MGFGGGGSGSFVLPNHTHTNALADGGALQELVSLVDATTIKAYSDAEYAANHVLPTIQEVTFATVFTTTSAVPVDVTGSTLTLPTVTNGKGLVIVAAQCANSSAGAVIKLDISNGGVDGGIAQVQASTAAYTICIPWHETLSLNGAVIKLRAFTDAGTLSVYGTTNSLPTLLSLLAVA